MSEFKKPEHVVLTSHSNQVYRETIPIKWGAKTAEERGPVIVSNDDRRNAIGSHSGAILSIAPCPSLRDNFPKITYPI